MVVGAVVFIHVLTSGRTGIPAHRPSRLPHSAGSAVEALALLEKEWPDVVLADIGMPGVDGYEFVRRLRAMGPRQGRELPVVALTALARSEDRRRAMLAGFDLHLAKPVEPAELVAVRRGRQNVPAGPMKIGEEQLTQWLDRRPNDERNE